MLNSCSVISKHQNDRITYASLDTRSNALARGLESVGINKGDRVGVMLGNSMEYAVVCWTTLRLGFILIIPDNICSIQTWGHSGRSHSFAKSSPKAVPNNLQQGSVESLV